MALVTVKIDHNQIEKVREYLRSVPHKLPVVLTRGINRTLTTVRAETVRRLKKAIKLDADMIRKRIRIYKATRTFLRGKVWIGGKDSPLGRFDARQSTRTRLVTADTKQSAWLYYNVFRKKYGEKARFSFHYKIRRRVPKVTYNLGKGRQMLEPAWIVEIRNFDHVMMPGSVKPPPPLYKNKYNMVFVSNMKLLEQAASTIQALQEFAGRKLEKNINDQVKLALAG